ncbi:protein YIF1A-like [Artemia franciscana]|uniref:Protein YIF1 n=1 Tax=Artemia franciscana TaxID=6661 RepID=A0AA88HFZ2_ARTSF|nr:hypothetical protein QYM36_013320 [Artemia franciscana]
MNRASRKPKRNRPGPEDTTSYMYPPEQMYSMPQQGYGQEQYPGFEPMIHPEYSQGVPVQPASIDPHQPTFVPQVPQNQSAAYYPTAPSDVASINVPNPLFQPAAASMAMQFGEVIVGQGKQALDREIGRYISTESLKYYFAVDTGYVINKLRILTLPYIHTDWTLKYSTDEPVQPRDDVNAPDLYIPLMAYITFIVLSGIAQGAQNKFTPEALGIEASSKLAWLTVEVLVILLTLYTISMPTSLKTLDIISFCGYKYVGMIAILLASFVFSSSGYTIAWIFYSASLMFFLVRSLKGRVQLHDDRSYGTKRSIYLLLFMAGIQPLLMWWMTRHLAVQFQFASPSE